MASRKGSTTKKGEDDGTGWSCKLCKAKFMDDKAEVMECEYCENHFCRKCLTMSVAEYKLLSKRSDLHWYCPPCEEKAVKSIKIEKEIEERCKEYFMKYESRLEKLETTIATKVDINQVKEIIEENVKKDVAEGGESAAEEVSEQINEFRESEARKCNIIVYNIEESEADETQDRKDADTNVVREICDIMKTNPANVKNVTRLGKRIKDTEGKVKSRPTKVIFGDEREKSGFMRNLRNLAEAEEKFKSISVTHDMTKRERALNKEKVNEAKDMNEKNESGDYKYVVIGPPWERRVVKVKIKNPIA